MLARAVPLLLLVAAGVYLTLALRLPFGAAARPGAGFYPVIVAVFAIVVALAATASVFRRAPRAEAEAVALDAAARRRVVISVMALAAFCLALLAPSRRMTIGGTLAAPCDETGTMAKLKDIVFDCENAPQMAQGSAENQPAMEERQQNG